MSHPSSPKFTRARQLPGPPRQARMGCSPQAPPFRAARCLPGPLRPPSYLLAPTRHCRAVIIGTPRGRLAHGVRSLLEIPLRKAPCEGGRQTDRHLRGHIHRQTDHCQEEATCLTSRLALQESHRQMQPQPHPRGPGGQAEPLHSSRVGLLAECLTPLRALKDKGCHTPGGETREKGVPFTRMSQGSYGNPLLLPRVTRWGR